MNYKVLNNQNEIKIYNGNIFPKPYNKKDIMEYAIFTLDNQTMLEIQSEETVNSAVIRPLSLNLKPEIENNKIFVHINKPVSFSVEINGKTDNNILIIVNPKRELNLPETNLIYFEKGEHKIERLTITEDNTTIYIEEGAYVHTKIHAENCSNLKICGGGILTMEQTQWEVPLSGRRCVDILNCKNVEICDIMIHDSVDWSLRISGCDNVSISNVNIIGSRGNSDGIDICGSRNVVVSDCFLRVWDDALVIKALDTGDIKNVIFKNCTVWNDFARPIEVGVELRAQNVSEVLFTDIDIIHSATGYPVMGIHHGDRAVVSDITFEKIRIEDAVGSQLFDVRIVDSVWNRDKTKGFIQNIKLSDIDVLGKSEFIPAKSRLQGFSEKSDIKSISFHNIRYLGQTATDIDSLNLLVQDYVSDIKVTYDGEIKPILPIHTTLETVSPFALNENGMYEAKLLVSAENKNIKDTSGEFKLHISPVNTAVYDNQVIKFNLKPYEKIQKTYDIILPPGKYCAFVNSSEPNLISSWLYISLDLALGKSLENAPLYTFSNYYGKKVSGVRMAAENNQLQIMTDFNGYDDMKLTVYSALPVSEGENEVKFTVEETDFGEAMAIIKGKHGLELAPQLRCPAEITYVFKNEPKVKEIVINEYNCTNEIISIPFEKLGIDNGCRNFWLEISLSIPEVNGNRYPLTLFHSVAPKTMSHMFVNVEVKQ